MSVTSVKIVSRRQIGSTPISPARGRYTILRDLCSLPPAIASLEFINLVEDVNIQLLRLDRLYKITGYDYRLT